MRGVPLFGERRTRVMAMLDRLGAEYVRSIIALSRQADAAGNRLSNRVYQADLGDGVAPEDEIARGERQDAALEQAIARITPEARRELRAVVMIGRGDFAAAQWEQAVARAQALSDASEIRALAEEAALAAYLSKGLYQLGLA
jgi:hypothetical protein